MCLYVRDGNKIEVAKYDITVYKVISNANKSLIFDFQYEPNTLYRLRRALEIRGTYLNDHPMVERGFHSYISLARAMDAMKYEWEEGKVVAFMIPKGARFLSGLHNEYVSTSIRTGSLDSYY